ncbi:MAG: hypothetical protein PHD72_03190 [Patescibacteria group bacterium]|nr:hypothetical protein [Patescibacteria group bacterium]
MQKIFLAVAVVSVLIFTGFGCANTARDSSGMTAEQKKAVATAKLDASVDVNISYFVSPNGPDDKLKYCNGADMDSAGYKNSLTKMVTSSFGYFGGNFSRSALINETIRRAAIEAGFSPNLADTVGYIKVASGTAYIKPTDGWAGVSIYLCTWQPFVEKNLEQFTEIKKVDWSISQEDFNKI